ncbi:hypothetical protein EI94DRAFT_1613549, partial [Lactarius quietus]
NAHAIRAISDRVDAITIPSHAVQLIIHLRSATTSTSATAKAPNRATPVPRDAPSFDIAREERVLQDIVNELPAQGLWITYDRRRRE